MPQAFLERGDFAKPLVASGLGEPDLCVGLDGVQARCLGGVEPQEWAADAGLELLTETDKWVTIQCGRSFDWV